MVNLDKRVSELYKEFSNLSGTKLVRNSQPGDAFSLLVFESLFQEHHTIPRLDTSHLAKIESAVVPPPDDGIDIFFEEANLDERKYHVVQCKYEKLDTVRIQECFLRMRAALDSYLKSPKSVGSGLRRIVSETDFDRAYEDECIYYVVHIGSVNSIRNQQPNWKILNLEALTSLLEGAVTASVPSEVFELDTANNFIVNNFADGKNAATDPSLPRSILCNLNGYDLAVLDEKYSESELGRNILYGGNLRESLSKKSKTFNEMTDTIDKQPELFLFYNNGITILAEDFNTPNLVERQMLKENIVLKNFSIINGAQTTSTLGQYLREARANKDQKAIGKLKKVFVLTKIYEINKTLVHHEETSERIKIFNNTQTPLSNRDMVSIRPEQNHLQKKCLSEEPKIFVNIKKGEQPPKGIKLRKHRDVSNEALAQLALCGFFFEPQTATQKKQHLFNVEGKNNVLLNETYEKLFHPDRGMLFAKSNREIDELLFINQLHGDTRTAFKKKINKQISDLSQQVIKEGKSSTERDKQVARLKRNLDIANKSLFYNVATYFRIRERFDFKIKNISRLAFNSTMYFEKKLFREALITSFSDLIFTRTIRVIREVTAGDNVYNWLRKEKNQDDYFEALENNFSEDYGLDDKYAAFVREYKVDVA